MYALLKTSGVNENSVASDSMSVIKIFLPKNDTLLSTFKRQLEASKHDYTAFAAKFRNSQRVLGMIKECSYAICSVYF